MTDNNTTPEEVAFDDLIIPEATGKSRPSEKYIEHISNLPLSYNEITGEVLLDGKSIYDPENKEISRLIFELRGCLERAFSKDAFYDYLTYYSKRNPINVVKDLFSQKWDGVKRLEAFCSYIRTVEGVTLFTPLTQWMVCTIQKWLNRSQSFMLALTGAPGLGKDYLFEFLNPFSSEYLVSGALDSHDKDAKIRSATNLIWVIGEVEGSMTRNDIESMKAFLTASSHSVRAPYGRREVKVTVKASYAATANSSDFIRDDSGRRILVVALKSIDQTYSGIYTKEDIRQLWLEAYSLGEEHPEIYKYSSTTLRAAILNSNILHREKEGFELLLDDRYEVSAGSTGSKITSGAVYSYLLAKGVKTNPRLISKYLKSVGALSQHTENGTVWSNLKERIL